VATYTIHEAEAAAGAADAGPRVEFVKDGFTWLGLLLPPVWFAWHRLWRELAIWLGAGLALSLFIGLIPGWDGVIPWVWLAAAVIIGFEGNELRRAHLERNGYRETGNTAAQSLEDCELRYFARRLDLGRGGAAAGSQSNSGG
jgi:Protein of unknown function (DUF2628)